MLVEYWPHVLAAASIAAAVGSTIHILLTKRDSRAAAAWVGLVWLSPIIGPALYYLIGINRIRRRASAMRPHPLTVVTPRHSNAALDVGAGRRSFVDFVDRVTDEPLVPGNQVDVLCNGEEAYPAMLEAIAGATERITMCTYIFDRDRAGQQFVDAFEKAVARGVEVRVIIDAVGARYSFPSIIRTLRKVGVKVARFSNAWWPWQMRYANLRTHRKILVVDDHIGFTGGMNVREGCLLELDLDAKHLTQDTHFRLRGPVVAQLNEVLAEDWEFCTRKKLPRTDHVEHEMGSVRCRSILDGPDMRLNPIHWTVIGGLAQAQERVRIVTPYFVPDREIIAALNTASLRGVLVEIILPAKGNLRTVQWASTALLWQILEHGCRIFLAEPPFDHSKLMLVDNDWSFVGSANWDARSFRLNFELNVECHDEDLCSRLYELTDKKLARAKEISLADVDGRSLPRRVRDNAARLLAPYL